MIVLKCHWLQSLLTNRHILDLLNKLKYRITTSHNVFYMLYDYIYSFMRLDKRTSFIRVSGINRRVTFHFRHPYILQPSSWAKTFRFLWRCDKKKTMLKKQFKCFTQRIYERKAESATKMKACKVKNLYSKVCFIFFISANSTYRIGHINRNLFFAVTVNNGVYFSTRQTCYLGSVYLHVRLGKILNYSIRISFVKIGNHWLWIFQRKADCC